MREKTLTLEQKGVLLAEMLGFHLVARETETAAGDTINYWNVYEGPEGILLATVYPGTGQFFGFADGIFGELTKGWSYALESIARQHRDPRRGE